MGKQKRKKQNPKPKAKPEEGQVETADGPGTPPTDPKGGGNR